MSFGFHSFKIFLEKNFFKI